MPYIIAIEVPKGGAGKTTTAINLSTYLLAAGLRVLGVDADGQASWSHLQGLFPKKGRPTLHTAIKQLVDTYEARLPIYSCPNGLKFIPASSALHQVEAELAHVERREYILQQLLAPVLDRFDVIVIDGPPAINSWTNNLLVVADGVIIPTQVEPLGIAGAGAMLEHLMRICRRKLLEKDLVVCGGLLTMMDSRTVLHRSMAAIARSELGAHIKFFESHIERSIQFPEAQFYKQSIEAYSPGGKGAVAYKALAEQVLAGTCQTPVVSLRVPVGFADNLLQAATAAEEMEHADGVDLPLEEVYVGE
jgi:chromosome partitioning protein